MHVDKEILWYCKLAVLFVSKTEESLFLFLCIQYYWKIFTLALKQTHVHTHHKHVTFSWEKIKESRWHHDKGMLCTLLTLSWWNPSQTIVMWYFDIFFALSPYELLNKESNWWWFELARFSCDYTVMEIVRTVVPLGASTSKKWTNALLFHSLNTLLFVNLFLNWGFTLIWWVSARKT